MAQRSRRIYKELDEVVSDVRSGVTIEILNESDISHLRGTFQGPPDTPYEGGLFVVDIKIPVSMLRYLVCDITNNYYSKTVSDAASAQPLVLTSFRSLQTTYHEVRHQSLSPQCVISDRRHLP